jgi:hypothetical protein
VLIVKRTALALTLILWLFSVAVDIGMISWVEANPNWAYTGADWKYVTTITGTGDQKTTILVPNQAHLSVSGTCATGSGSARFGIYFGGGGSNYQYSSAGLHSAGFTTFSSRRGPANLSLVIRTLHVLNYTVVVEYDAAAPTTTSTSPSPTPSPSPSPLPSITTSPEPQQSELFPTAYSMGIVAAIVLVLLGSIIYVLKRKN